LHRASHPTRTPPTSIQSDFNIKKLFKKSGRAKMYRKQINIRTNNIIPELHQISPVPV
jgi:hypothetical protein